MEKRWFLITHKECRSTFKVNTKYYGNGDKHQYKFHCPGCHEPATIEFQEELEKFFTKYLALIHTLDTDGYSIEEITDQYDVLQANTEE